MDLSEIPHDQWDYTVRQLALLNSSGVCKFALIYIVNVMLASFFFF
jgi:hypothetical protein